MNQDNIYICIYFFLFFEGKKGWGELFSRNNDFSAPGGPALLAVTQARDRPKEAVAYARDVFPWYMEATDLNGTVSLETGLGSGSRVVVLRKV